AGPPGPRRDVADLRGDSPGDDRQPVGYHTHRPGSERYVGDSGVQGMPEHRRPVHQVLERPARSAKAAVEPPDQPLDRVRDSVHPALPAEDPIEEQFSRAVLGWLPLLAGRSWNLHLQLLPPACSAWGGNLPQHRAKTLY